MLIDVSVITGTGKSKTYVGTIAAQIVWLILFSGSATSTQIEVMLVLNKPNVNLFKLFVKVTVCDDPVLFGTKELIGVRLVTPSAVTSSINCVTVKFASFVYVQLKLTTKSSPDHEAVTFSGLVGIIINGPDPPGYVFGG